MESDSLTVARHEAAHALAALILGIPFTSVTIESAGGVAGHVQFICESDDGSVLAGVSAATEQDRRVGRHWIRTLLNGPLTVGADAGGAGNDLIEAGEIALVLSGSDLDRAAREVANAWAWCDCLKTDSGYRACLQRLVDALIAERTVQAAAVEALGRGGPTHLPRRRWERFRLGVDMRPIIDAVIAERAARGGGHRS